MTAVPERFWLTVPRLCAASKSRSHSHSSGKHRVYSTRIKLTPCLTLPQSPEKKYAHYVSEASWAGARIIQGQWTEEARRLYDLIILVFSENERLANLEALKKNSGVSEEEWEDLIQYSSQVRAWFCHLHLGSNWRSRFEQSGELQIVRVHKIIPRIPKEKFGAVIKASSNASNALGIWESVCVRSCEGIPYRKK